MSFSPNTVKLRKCTIPSGSLKINKTMHNFHRFILFLMNFEYVSQIFVIVIKNKTNINDAKNNYLGIGFDEKSTTWRDWHSLIASGMSPMSEIEKKIFLRPNISCLFNDKFFIKEYINYLWMTFLAALCRSSRVLAIVIFNFSNKK